MLVKTFGGAVFGIDATIIVMEVSITVGVNFQLVGLPDNAVKESQQRIDAALRACGSKIPGKRVVINMAPADIRKEGSAYDLPLALGILAAAEEMQSDRLEQYLIMGELSLDGSIQPIKGALSIALKAKEEGFGGFILPAANALEASVVDGLDVFGIAHIQEVIDFFNKKNDLQAVPCDVRAVLQNVESYGGLDFSDVKGQENVKRALEVAAAGGHNVLMIGPPGAGKTMLAKRISTIIPPLTLTEALETTKIHSVAGKMKGGNSLIVNRPFRSPHHTISDVALVGGGSYPQPGEISLAHNGVLFLDELPEFKRTVLEVLRQPLEDRLISVSRARFSVDYPASFMMVASMNPCPCGYYNHPEKDCLCPPGLVQKYLNRLSGPLLDRIDMHIEVVPVSVDHLSNPVSAEPSSSIRERVVRARQVQTRRFALQAEEIHANAQMSTRQIRQYCHVSEACRKMLQHAIEKLGLSARAYDRILKVSRTIADLDDADAILPVHLAEAIQYRSLDRDIWVSA